MSETVKVGLHNLARPAGASTDPKRKGRGPGTGLGKTAGRGHKGQRARAGGRVRTGFEGGQMPLIRRVPKRGFHNLFREVPQIVNLDDVVDGVTGEEITPAILAEAGLVRDGNAPVKILGRGEISRAFKVQGCALSKTARDKIVQAGGVIEA
jgi:large subunit ribosomal protein L15